MIKNPNILSKSTGQKLLKRLTQMLIEAGQIDLNSVFINKTKTEVITDKYKPFKRHAVTEMMLQHRRWSQLLWKYSLRNYVRNLFNKRTIKNLKRSKCNRSGKIKIRYMNKLRHCGYFIWQI